MTSQRDSTSPRKQRTAQHPALQAAAKDGSSSRNGSSPGTGSTPSERNTQSPAGAPIAGGEQPPPAAGTAVPAGEQGGSATVADRQLPAAADAHAALAGSQPHSEHQSGSDQGLQPTQEGSIGAEAAEMAGNGGQPPSSQGAGLDLNLSPQEAMLTGVRPRSQLRCLVRLEGQISGPSRSLVWTGSCQLADEGDH
jgi:hypothetical protein